MSVQEIVALAIVAAAAAWLIARLRRRGLDEEEARACSHCGHAPPSDPGESIRRADDHRAGAGADRDRPPALDPPPAASGSGARVRPSR